LKATRRRFNATPEAWSLIALAAGLVLGIYGFKTGSPMVAGMAGLVQPVGVLWVNALQMAVLPLVVMQLLTAIAGNGNGASVGGAGKRTASLIVITLSLLATVGYFVAAPLMGLVSVPPETVGAIRESILIPDFVQGGVEQAPVSIGEWLTALVPTNVLRAVVQGNLIQVLLVTIVFGLAVNQLPEKQQRPLAELFRAGSEAVMVVIRWILLAAPVGIFALVVGLALGTGSDLVELLIWWVLLSQGILLFFVIAIYPVTALLGRVPLGRFARAVAGPQLVGLSTRSSIASMPAQIESGKKWLGFSSTTSGLVVPLLVSTLKVQTAWGNSVRVLFLAHIFGVNLSLTQLVTFTITIMLISLTAVGIPNPGGANTYRALPAYLAVGIPVEGLVLLQPVGDLVDYGDTLANTTGQFAAATILSRRDRAASLEAGRLG